MSGPQPKQSFSVASSNQKRSVKARAIVTHIGGDESGGDWLCSKDGKGLALCNHVRLAEAYLKELGRWSETEEDNDATRIPLDAGKRLRSFYF